MTLADLGKHTKSLHPIYSHIPDAELGRLVQKRYPGFFDHAEDETPDLDSATVPETPRTLAIQLQQLQDGIRRVVFIPRGAQANVNPADIGMKRLTLPSGNYIYNPALIKPQEIKDAIKNHELGEILGSADKGYGSVDKTELQGDPVAVVARDEDGETAHSALTDMDHIQEAIDAAGDVTPPHGNVSVEPPDIEIAHRELAQQEAKPKRPTAGRRWPKA